MLRLTASEMLIGTTEYLVL